MRTRMIAGALVVACVALGATVGTAQATYPGSNDGRIAFGSTIDGNAEIYSTLPNGEALHQLTDDPLFDACPAYSADGKRIAWCHGVGAAGGVIEIWTMKQNGEDKKQLTSLGGRMTFPDFSPDGSKVVFSGRLPGATNDDVFVIGADGGGLAQLTSSSASDRFAAFSPDGSKIVFLSARSGTEQVWLMDADGSDQMQLTFDAARKDQVPDWSPDGSRIAYVSVTGAGPGGDLWIMDADGSDQTQITSGDPSEYGAAWSPDGERIAFLEFKTRTVYVMNADGTGRYAVHPLGVQAVPAWQPRGDRR